MDFAERLLAGGGAIEIRPLTPDASAASAVGQCSVLHGFTIRLIKDA